MTTPFAARGRVWYEPHTRQWRYQVTDHQGQIIAWDDCRDYNTIQDGCRVVVAAATRMSMLGQQFRPYIDIIHDISLGRGDWRA